jgi:ribonuclease-3 family protein
MGDAYYELKIRTYLINQRLTGVDILHKQAIKFTSGTAQSKIVEYLISSHLISEEEMDVFKRGRNVSGPGRKNISAKDYHQATGFEAMIGHLYLSNIHRADELIGLAIKFIEEGDSYGKNSC